MCGLAGYAVCGPVAQDEGWAILGRMVRTLAHRGPDDENLWLDADSGVGLAHRRLAVVDLTHTGRQPMASAEGRFILLFNGEIYNHGELRRLLQSQGRQFRGTSDTEVLAEAFSAWGIDATLPRLNGFFAIAAWDRLERRLTLIRDRVGKKPLYWLSRPGLFLFGSEPRALLAHPGWTPELDVQAVAQFLRLACVPAPMTIFAGMRKLMPGGMVALAADGRITESRWWEPSALTTGGGDHTADLHALLLDAVRIRLEADVPVGALLSGGIDSSLVAALAQQVSPYPVRTFTVGFEVAGYDESAAARAIAKALHTDHAEIRVGAAEALATIPKLPAIWDEPFADSSQIPTLLVAEFARRYVTVVLSGDGGDEAFAGYNRHLLARMSAHLARIPAPARAAVARLLRSFGPVAWDRLGRAFPAAVRPPQLGDKLYKAAGVLGGSLESQYAHLVSIWPEPERVVRGAEAGSLPWHISPLPQNPVDAMRLLDLAGYLPDDVLVKVDRATMAVGLEARGPLLDHRVLALGWRYAADDHFREGRGKAQLRQILFQYLPPKLFDRPKSGFAVPLAQWLRGPLREWAEDLLSPAALADGLLNERHIRAAWADLMGGRAPTQHRLWTVLMLQAWRREWAV